MFYFHYINILFILYHFYIKKRTDGKNWQLTYLLFYFILFIYIIPFLHQKKDGREGQARREEKTCICPNHFFFFFAYNTHDGS